WEQALWAPTRIPGSRPSRSTGCLWPPTSGWYYAADPFRHDHDRYAYRYHLAGLHQMGCQRPDPRHCPGPRDRPGTHGGLDEPRGPAAHRTGEPCHLLVTIAWQTVAQGRGVRSRAG